MREAEESAHATHKTGGTMNKPTLKERFQYWFDNRMAKGSRTLIELLLLSSVVIVILLVILMTVLSREGSFFSNLWNGFVTLINAWMPEYDPSDPPNILSLLFTALIAVYGILFTSILIGIVTTSIEEKVVSLRKGNSAILEKDHSVILGFTPGEYTLLREIILSFGKEPGVIVVADPTDKEEMEEMIFENVEIPKHLKVICRSLDIFDPIDLQRLAVKQAEEIIINPTHNEQVTKILLALGSFIEETDPVRISAILYKDEYRLPESYARKHRMYTLQTNDTIAKMIARSCIQPGLSKVLVEVFDFQGDEFYLQKIDGIDGFTFEKLSLSLDEACPLGYMRDGTLHLNPPAEERLSGDDRIVLFTKEKDAYRLGGARNADLPAELQIRKNHIKQKTNVCILGYNKSLKMILRELPLNVGEVMIVNPDTDEERIEELRQKFPALDLRVSDYKLLDEEVLVSLTKQYSHIIVLSRHLEDIDEDDMRTSFTLLRLRDIRERYHLDFNITAEMRTEFNQNLISDNDHTDFIVASNMAARFLAQLSQNNELLSLFSEILSNQGNEIQLIRAEEFGAEGTFTAAQLRKLCLVNGFVLMGCLSADGEYCFNPPLEAEAVLGKEDQLIVIG